MEQQFANEKLQKIAELLIELYPNQYKNYYEEKGEEDETILLPVIIEDEITEERNHSIMIRFTAKEVFCYAEHLSDVKHWEENKRVYAHYWG